MCRTVSSGPCTNPSWTIAARSFPNLASEVLENLRPIFQTSGPVILYPGSGTGAWEAAIVNTLSPGDRVLMFETGHFSNLWRQVAESFGIQVEYVPGNWRRGASAEDAAARLDADKSHTLKAVIVVHNETSTGATSCIHEIRHAMDQAHHPALLMVDTISSLGSIDYRHDEWGVDVTVAGSQKGLMMPPGLSFNAISERALAANKSGQIASVLLGLAGDVELPIAPASFPILQLPPCSTVCGKRLRCCRRRACRTYFFGMIVTQRPPVPPCERGVWR